MRTRLVLASASYAQTFEKKNFNYSKFAKGAFSEVALTVKVKAPRAKETAAK